MADKLNDKRRKAQQRLGPSTRVELSPEGVVRLSSDPLLLRKCVHFPCWEAESETQRFRFEALVCRPGPGYACACTSSTTGGRSVFGTKSRWSLS